MRLLVHACCGPCAIMPLWLLAQEGHEIDVHFANANIAPESEYAKRLETLKQYAESQGIRVIEGAYDTDAWERAVAPLGEAVLRGDAGITREDRCRACYRLRLEESGAYAREAGYEGLTTTLAISPYQLRDVMHEELDRACAAAGITSVFRDFTPHYAEAVRISRNLGMYRQGYCGCRFSIDEAKRTRELQRLAKEQKRAAREALQRKRAQEAEAKAIQKRTYAERQAWKRSVLKELRQKERDQHEDK